MPWTGDELPAPDVVPVFPLPGAVLFPHTVLPLHVFEPRYRRMVRDAVQGQGLIAIALLQPGWEDQIDGNPPIHSVATVGRIENLRQQEDGRSYLDLVGIERVELVEIPSDQPYRLAQALPLPESGGIEDDPRTRQAKLDLLATHGCLMRELSAERHPNIAMDDRLPYSAAVNGACANLPVDASVRQELLEVQDLDARRKRALSLTEQVLKKVLSLRSANRRPEDDRSVN